MRRAVSVLALLGLLFSALPRVYAQSGSASAAVTAIDSNGYPDIHVYVAVAEGSGQHISRLAPTDFALTENGQPILNVSTVEQEVGVQVVFALDTNAAFKTRDAAGVNRLEYIRQALTTFAQTQMSADVDDITLLTPEATLVTHVGGRDPLIDALNRYTPDFSGAADAFEFVSRALDFASDATPRPGMKRVLVYLANGLGRTGNDVPINDLLTRVQAAGVQIHTVFVGPEGAEAIPGALTQRKLSDETGGLVVSLRGPESLAAIFESLTNQSRQYHLNYRSALKATGEHTVAVRVQLPDGSILTTPDSTFPLRIEPPIVTLPNLPAELSVEASTMDYAVPIVINFPDGHVRALTQAQLLVNGQLVDGQTTAEVETLNWPLLGVTGNTTHTLQAQVTDELGLTALSNPVTVFVVRGAEKSAPTASLASEPEAIPPAMVLLAVGVALVAAGGVGAFWLLHRQTRPPATPSANADETMPGRPLISDVRLAALLQPDLPSPPGNGPAVSEASPSDLAATSPSPAVKSKTPLRVNVPALPHVQWPYFHRPSRAPKSMGIGAAYLEVVEPVGGGEPMEAIELTGSSLRLGRDANLADAIFNDRSVSRLHARIEIANGVFKILDEGSTSGTWVNFNQIPAQGGHELKPGDLINLGRVQLRFQVREAALTGALGSANGTSAHAPQTSDTAAGHSDMADIPQRHRPVKPPSTD